MLSRIISSRDAAGVASAALPYTPPQYSQTGVRHATPGLTDADPDLQVLRDRIRHLQAETETAKRDSFEAGRRQGEQQARAELGPVIERMNASIAELTGLRSEMRRRAEKDVVQLALLIAKRILHREVSVDASALTALARVVFERMARAEAYRVTVHPGFAAAIRSALPAGQAGRVQIEPDPACAAGTLVIRSEEGVIDASVDSQLEEISLGLADRLARAGIS
ncbi:MAG: FliH/SctL family protein [Acidobacteriota bacterium]